MLPEKVENKIKKLTELLNVYNGSFLDKSIKTETELEKNRANYTVSTEKNYRNCIYSYIKKIADDNVDGIDISYKNRKTQDTIDGGVMWIVIDGWQMPVITHFFVELPRSYCFHIDFGVWINTNVAEKI